VLLRLSNGPEQPEVVTVLRHKKHPPAGVKATTRSQARPGGRVGLGWARLYP